MVRLLFLTMLLTTCSTTNHLNKIKKVTLESRTRGFQKTVTIDGTSLTSYINSWGNASSTVTKIDANSWEAMCACLTALPLDRLAELSSDVSDIAVDRAAMTSLLVELSDEEIYESGMLDLSQPPPALDCFYKIYNTIITNEE